jgi:Flp pilus assembly pilin Flp
MGRVTIGRLRQLGSEDTAASAVEYAVLLALIIAVLIATIQVIGTKVENGFNDFDKSFKP